MPLIVMSCAIGTDVGLAVDRAQVSKNNSTYIALLGQTNLIHNLPSPPACNSGKFQIFSFFIKILFITQYHVTILVAPSHKIASFASVNVSSANKTIAPWCVVSLDPSQNFGEVYESVPGPENSLLSNPQEIYQQPFSSLTA